jgi:hypothetical protein
MRKISNNKMWFMALLLVVFTAGCSGGSSSGAGAGAPFSTLVVSGVAAAGAPIIGNAYLKDSANNVIGPAAIGADGSFSFNVTRLRPPFYLLAVGHVGLTDYLLYSVTTSASGIANINPLTNVIVAAAAGGIDPASVYGDPAAHPVTNEKIDTAITDLQVMLGPLLAEYGAGNVNPISDSFTADHTKLDKVFDVVAITVDSSGGDVLVVVTDNFTGQPIAGGSTGDLGNPATTTPVTPADVPFIGNITKGADRLIATQNDDGGWDWPNPDNDSKFPKQTSPANTIGVTAQGLLDAYKITKNNIYLNACINKTYNLLLSNSTNPIPYAGYRRDEIRGPDITFLVELSEVTGDSTYANLARTWYLATLSNFFENSATKLAESIRNGRLPSQSALISWGINLDIQGVLALNRYFAGQGFNAHAASMTEVIYNSFYVTPVVNLSDPTQDWYGFALSGAIEAFTSTGLHLDKIDSLKSALIASQLPDGSFESSTQTTAYAVMALLKAGEINAANAKTKKGVKYLVNRQSVGGIWLDSDSIEYTESDSEAIHAIYNFQK